MTGMRALICPVLCCAVIFIFCGFFTACGDEEGTNSNSVTSSSESSRQYGLPPIMVRVSPGDFAMGSPTGEINRENYETQHWVTLTRGLFIGKYEVTQGQYTSVMGYNPSNFTNSPAAKEIQAGRPAEQVSWFDAIVFCNTLSMRSDLDPVYSILGSTDPDDWGEMPDGNDHANFAVWDAVTMDTNANGYRLPTEAEWEYACRAGTTTAYTTGAAIGNTTGWYKDNSANKTHEAGRKASNALRLFDMHGNVREWCWDRYGEGYYTTVGAGTDPTGPATGMLRVFRGGSWYDEAKYLRSAARDRDVPWRRDYRVGFRLARSAFE